VHELELNEIADLYGTNSQSSVSQRQTGAAASAGACGTVPASSSELDSGIRPVQQHHLIFSDHAHKVLNQVATTMLLLILSLSVNCTCHPAAAHLLVAQNLSRPALTPRNTQNC
jgi:hypothetical protein